DGRSARRELCASRPARRSLLVLPVRVRDAQRLDHFAQRRVHRPAQLSDSDDANLLGANAIFQNISTRFGFRSEAGGWISWPLLPVIALYIHSRWRKPAGKVLTVMLALLALATLGPRLHLDGHALVGLPWKIVEHLPLMKSALPARLTIYAF